MNYVAAGSGSSNRAAVDLAFVAAHFSAPSVARQSLRRASLPSNLQCAVILLCVLRFFSESRYSAIHPEIPHCGIEGRPLCVNLLAFLESRYSAIHPEIPQCGIEGRSHATMPTNLNPQHAL